MPLTDALKELCAELEGGASYDIVLSQIAETEAVRSELLDRKFKESYGSPERYTQRKVRERSKRAALLYRGVSGLSYRDVTICRGSSLIVSGHQCFLAAVTDSDPSKVVGIECQTGLEIVEEYDRAKAADLVVTLDLKALGLA